MDENFYLIAVQARFVKNPILGANPRKQIPMASNFNVYHSCTDFSLVTFLDEMKDSLESKNSVKV